MSVQLKPCPNPWCGAQPILCGRLRDDGMRYACMKCSVGPPLAKTEAEAVERWNTRAALSGVDGLVEALDNMCGAYAALCEEFGQPHHRIAGSKYSHAIAALARYREGKS